MRSEHAFVLSLAVAASVIAARADAESAQEILDRVKAVNDARRPKDSTQKGMMKIYGASGDERTRELLIYNKTQDKRSSKSVTFFLAPPELRNVGVLTWVDQVKDDNQWIYFPATGRLRRLSRDFAKEDLGDSDFSYEDSKLFGDLLLDATKVGTPSLEKAADTVAGVPCVVIRLKVDRTDSNYGQLVMWIDESNSTLRKMEFYDRDQGTLLKVLTVNEFSMVDNVPTPRKVEMTTVPKGSKTIMEFTDVRYNLGLSDEIFTERGLKRGPM